MEEKGNPGKVEELIEAARRDFERLLEKIRRLRPSLGG
jgi:hypothetical protein